MQSNQNNSLYKDRQSRLAAWLKKEGIDAALIEDAEGRRNRGLRYLCGMPSDAILFVLAEGSSYPKGSSILLPWDIHLAENFAVADILKAYTDYSRSITSALPGVLKEFDIDAKKVEISETTPYPLWEELKKAVVGVEIICRKGGTDSVIDGMRNSKDAGEIALYRKLCGLTDEVTEDLISRIADGSITTELETAMFIEGESRKQDCEGTGFETLAAGPGRSYAIHPYPAFTDAPIGTEGFSIVDFGIMKEGYTSDVTITIARGALSRDQEEVLALVEEAHDLAEGLLKPGAGTKEIAMRVDEFFKDKGHAMPHSLGHGIGLDPHEAPTLRSLDESSEELKPGMIIALEPGLYHPDLGGARLEDDYLITEEGAEKLTSSRIARLP